MRAAQHWIVASACTLAWTLATESDASAQGPAANTGVTFAVEGGAGIGRDSALDDYGVGTGGLDLAVGGFVTPQLALLGQVSHLRFGVSGRSNGSDLGQVSGVAGPVLQYWPRDRLHIRAGAGLAFWKVGDQSDYGLGLVVGAGVTVFRRGRHTLQAGVQIAPVFIEPQNAHSAVITFGYPRR
jgi:hypothetical protein